MEKNIVRDMELFESNFLFFQLEIDSLRKKYLNKFVAIKDKKVIGSASSIEELTPKLKKAGVDISKTVVEFVPEEETILVL